MTFKSTVNPFTGKLQLVVDDALLTSLNFLASVANEAALPSEGNTENDARFTDDANHLYVWNGSAWVDIGARNEYIWDNITGKPTSTIADIDDAVTKKHSHTNKTELDKVTDGDHDVRTDNPHEVDKSDVGLGNVTDDAQLKRAAGDINSFTEKETPVSADLILIEDSEAANAKKKLQIGNLPGGSGTDENAIHDNVSGEINALTEKNTPANTDILIIEDSANGNAKKKIQIGNLPGGEGGGDVSSVNGQTGAVVLDADDIDDTLTTNKFTTAAEASKLSGIETGADVTDADNVNPVEADPIVGAVNGIVKADGAGNISAAVADTDYQSVLGFTPEDSANKGEVNGYAELDENGKVPTNQLPSYVDDVVESANFASLPGSGETGKIYVTLDDGKTYRWSGSEYVEISASLALGETSATAYRGDRGKTAYDHSQLSSGNPHSVSASDIGVESGADVTDATNVGTAIHGVDAKGSFADNDAIPVIDSETSNVLKKNLWSVIKSTLKTYFDTLYIAVGSAPTGSIVGTTDSQTLTNKEISDGTLTSEFTAGENLVAGNLAYLKSDGKIWKVDADAESTSKGLLVLVLDTINTDATGTCLLKGKYTTTGLTAGDELFVSTTAGTWQNTAPSGSGDVVRVIGYALSTTVLYFDPDKSYYEVA